MEGSLTFYFLFPGLVFKKLGKTDDALDCFHKLQVITPNNPEVLYQLGNLYLFMLRVSSIYVICQGVVTT